MRTTRLICALLTALVASFAVRAEENTANVHITITNVNSTDGKIFIEFFNSEESMKASDPTATKIVEATIPESNAAIYLAEGEYAFRMYHDTNDDGELNMNLIRIPKEPAAFSNNAKPRFGPPGWDKMKFSVADENVEQTVELIKI